MQKAKKTNAIRGRDMVSPIDARDYEPVEGSWIRSGNLCSVLMAKFHNSDRYDGMVKIYFQSLYHPEERRIIHGAPDSSL